MRTPVLETKGFAAAVIDALASHICVVDPNGMIVAVNRAWQDFGAANPPVSNSGVGAHYLQVCGRASGPGSQEAEAFAAGVRSVLEGRTALFKMEYPCHSASENRWYLGRVTPLKADPGGAVISHLNITDRKLIEFKLERLAATDPLTDLPNRRYFMDSCNQELERVQRFVIPSSVVMIDLDHFKAINDTYGHAVGDETLRRFSFVCKAALRDVDVLARLGGEEFVVLVPGADEAGATLVAEKLRCAVHDMHIETAQPWCNVTASFGVAEILSNDREVDECLARADMALYFAKGAGRDRVEMFSSLQRSAGPTRVGGH